MKLSEAEARALGLIPKRRARTTRRALSASEAPHHTRCHTCGTEFRSDKAEGAHADATSHARYDLVLEVAR